MQEKSLEPKEALEDERGVQGLDEIEEWGIGVKVKIILEEWKMQCQVSIP